MVIDLILVSSLEMGFEVGCVLNSNLRVGIPPFDRDDVCCDPDVFSSANPVPVLMSSKPDTVLAERH